MEEPIESARRSRFVTLLTRLVAPAISLAGLAFVTKAIADHRQELVRGFGSVSPAVLVACAASGTAGMVLIALAWRSVLATYGARLPLGRTVGIYFRGEIGKYVPGSVWPVIGRAELVARTGAGRLSAYSSVLVGLAALYSAAGAVMLLAVAVDGSRAAAFRLGALGVLLVAGALVLFGPTWRLLSQLLLRVSKGRVRAPTRNQYLKLVVLSIPPWLVITLTTWVIVRSLAPDAGYVAVLAATCFSWLGGFLAIPVPGGLGVRESLFVLGLAAVAPGPAAASALLARLTFMCVDGAGALIATAVSGPKRSTEPPAGSLLEPSPSSREEAGAPASPPDAAPRDS